LCTDNSGAALIARMHMNTAEQTYQTLVDTVVAASVTWIDVLQHDATACTVLAHVKQVLQHHLHTLTATELLHMQRYLHDHGLLQCDANTDMFQAVHDSVWNTIEIELSKLYA